MAGFDLVPVDGGSPIHLPVGESLLGRGPFLGVSDKRVSRHHGLLENLNGQLRIKPTHVNPCFCQSSLDDPPQPLDRNQWYKLGQGDIISLLPGKYIYKVVVVGEDGTVRNSQAFQDEDEAVIKSPPASPESSDEPAYPTRQGKGWTPRSHEQESRLGGSVDQKEPDEQLPNPPTSNQTEAGVAEAENDKNETRPEPKKRVLPAWMMVPVAAPKSPTTSTKVLGAGNRGRGTATPTTSTNQGTAKRARATAPLSGEEESEHSEAEPTPRKRVRRRRKKSDEDEDDEDVQSKTALKTRQQVKPCKVEESEESDHFDMEEEEEEDDGEKRRGGEASAAKGSSTSTSRAEASESEDRGRQPQNDQKVAKGPQETGEVSGAAQSRARLRTTCPYGKDCYRKNPVHFQECSHPGNSDYEDSAKDDEEEEEEDADRPECPYGTDCYRKNPLHWKEYKHAKRTRAKKPVSYNNNNNNDDDDDEFGDDDSFINDESEDIDEDSDYEPPDSDDSGKEDLKRLKKEAKAFTKWPKLD